MSNISVLLVDDHNIVRQGLRALLIAEGDITIVAEAQTGREALLEEPRIERVLGGLRPPIAIKGQPPVRWKLAERMADSHVPGLSIAVIDDGKIAWARGFGVRETGTNEPVTTATLFEAQSISKAVAATAKRASVGRNTLAALANVDMPTSAAAFCLSSRGDRDPGCGDRPFL